MLSDRKAAVLRAVVEGYITTSEPVGSAQVGRESGLDVSSATIRSEMVALEEDGYLSQPHTSAGRVPSDKGYRYFVDTLMEPHTLGASQTQKVSAFFETAQSEIERMLRDTSSFLTQLTDYAAVVVGPTVSRSPIMALQLVRLATDQAMAVIVHSNASIERIMVAIDADDTDDDIQTAGDALATAWIGSHIGEADRSYAPTGSERADAIAQACHAAITEATAQEEPSNVYVEGASAVAGIFDAVEQVKDVLLVLEKQYTVVTLVRDVIDRGLNVAIGSETGLAPLAECSLVVAPVEVDGEQAGSIGVLGPTRMHYSEAMATVALVSRQMSRRLAEGA